MSKRLAHDATGAMQVTAAVCIGLAALCLAAIFLMVDAKPNDMTDAAVITAWIAVASGFVAICLRGLWRVTRRKRRKYAGVILSMRVLR